MLPRRFIRFTVVNKEVGTTVLIYQFPKDRKYLTSYPSLTTCCSELMTNEAASRNPSTARYRAAAAGERHLQVCCTRRFGESALTLAGILPNIKS